MKMMAKLIAAKQGPMDKSDSEAKMRMLEALKEEMSKMMSAKPEDMKASGEPMESDMADEDSESPEMEESEEDPSSEIEELAGDELSDDDIMKLEEILAKAKASKMKAGM